MIWSRCLFLAKLCILLLIAGGARAQDSSAVPACVTNIDAQGTLYQGYFGVVTAPAAADDVEFDESKLQIVPSIRFGLSSLVGVLPDTPTGLLDLKFYATDAALILHCQVNVKVFDPQTDPISDLALGSCPALQEPLTVGSAILPRSERRYSETAIAFGGQIDMTSISDQQFVLMGLSEGLGQYTLVDDFDLALGRDSDFRFAIASLMGLCPVQVVAKNDDQTQTPMCLTADQQPAALQVGEQVVLEVPALPYGAKYIPNRAFAVDKTVANAHIPRRSAPEPAPSDTTEVEGDQELVIVQPAPTYGDLQITASAVGTTDIVVAESANMGAKCRITVE